MTKQNESMTGKQMCELISQVIKQECYKNINPKDVWNMSPTGELWPVFELYEWAKNVLK